MTGEFLMGDTYDQRYTRTVDEAELIEH